MGTLQSFIDTSRGIAATSKRIECLNEAPRAMSLKRARVRAALADKAVPRKVRSKMLRAQKGKASVDMTAALCGSAKASAS